MEEQRQPQKHLVNFCVKAENCNYRSLNESESFCSYSQNTSYENKTLLPNLRLHCHARFLHEVAT